MTAAVAVLAGISLAGEARSAPLGDAECAALKSERDGEAGRRARADMSKGAAWGKANLDAARLQAIRRAIEVEEQVLFRCPVERPAAEPVEAKAAPAAPATRAAASAGRPDASGGAVRPDAAAAAETARDAVKPAAAPRKPPRKPKQDAAVQGEAGEGKAVGEPVPVETKRRAAQKPAQKPAQKSAPSDAYVPPAGEPQSVLKPPPGAEPARQE